MPPGYVAHYTTPLSADQLTASFSAFESAGLFLENPSTRAASLLDEYGDQIRTDRAGLERAVTGVAVGEHVTFQFWFPFSDSTDVVCTYMRITDWLTVRQYWLDGLSSDEKERVITLVCSQLAVPTPRTIALVIDRQGAAGDTDFDAIVQEKGERDRRSPADLFLMS